MASYLRPRRGRKATAENQNIILKKGEVFFEAPDTGVGKGIGKIKVGDGVTVYSSLPYFMEQPTVIDPSESTISFTEANDGNNSDLLNSISTGSKLNVVIGIIKRMLRKLDSSTSSLSSSLSGKSDTNHVHDDRYFTESEVNSLLNGKSNTDHNHNGVYQPVGSYAASNHNHNGVYQAAGSYASSTHTHDDRYYTESEVNNLINGRQPAGSYAAASHSHDERYYTEGEINSLLASKANWWQKGTSAPGSLADNEVFFVYE